jgi:hypothetical protein
MEVAIWVWSCEIITQFYVVLHFINITKLHKYYNKKNISITFNNKKNTQQSTQQNKTHNKIISNPKYN